MHAILIRANTWPFKQWSQNKNSISTMETSTPSIKPTPSNVRLFLSLHITHTKHKVAICQTKDLSSCQNYFSIQNVNHYTLRARLDWRGREEEWRRVKFAENRLILGQLYSTLLYFPSLPLDPNGELGITQRNPNNANTKNHNSWATSQCINIWPTISPSTLTHTTSIYQSY